MQSRTRSGWSRFLLITKPFFLSKPGKWGIGLFSLLLLLVLFVKGLDIRNSYVYGDLITSATEKKADRVCHLALLYAGVFAISALVATLLRFTEEMLGLRWRGWLTRHLTDRYLANRAYHHIKTTGQLDNPDQRISEDVKTFTTNTLSIVLILVNATVALAGFAALYWLYRNRERFGGGSGYVKDPVCGMQVDMANPGAVLHEDGHTTYFCSGHCRDHFTGQAAIRS